MQIILSVNLLFQPLFIQWTKEIEHQHTCITANCLPAPRYHMSKHQICKEYLQLITQGRFQFGQRIEKDELKIAYNDRRCVTEVIKLPFTLINSSGNLLYCSEAQPSSKYDTRTRAYELTQFLTRILTQDLQVVVLCLSVRHSLTI